MQLNANIEDLEKKINALTDAIATQRKGVEEGKQEMLVQLE